MSASTHTPARCCCAATHSAVSLRTRWRNASAYRQTHPLARRLMLLVRVRPRSRPRPPHVSLASCCKSRTAGAGALPRPDGTVGLDDRSAGLGRSVAAAPCRLGILPPIWARHVQGFIKLFGIVQLHDGTLTPDVSLRRGPCRPQTAPMPRRGVRCLTAAICVCSKSVAVMRRC